MYPRAFLFVYFVQSFLSYPAMLWMRYEKIVSSPKPGLWSERGWISHTMTVLGVACLIITVLSTPIMQANLLTQGSLAALSHLVHTFQERTHEAYGYRQHILETLAWPRGIWEKTYSYRLKILICLQNFFFSITFSSCPCLCFINLLM